MKILLLIFPAVFIFASCNQAQQNDSPKQVFSKYLSAKADKDVEIIKQLISKGSLKMIEQSAKDQGTTIDELLKVDDQSSAAASLELGEERIENDTAIVEVKNPRTNEWEKMPFVKEDGKWKIALDVAMENALQKFREMMRNSPDEPQNSNMNSNQKSDK